MGAQQLYAVGDDAALSVAAFGEGGYYFESQNALIEALQARLKKGEHLLIKGSRSQKMQTSSLSLRQTPHTSRYSENPGICTSPKF